MIGRLYASRSAIALCCLAAGGCRPWPRQRRHRIGRGATASGGACARERRAGCRTGPFRAVTGTGSAISARATISSSSTLHRPSPKGRPRPGCRGRAEPSGVRQETAGRDSAEHADHPATGRSASAGCCVEAARRRHPAPTTQPPRAAPSPAPAAPQPSVATLDFTSLITRLRETKAISVFTKISVKNQSDDLLEKFRSYHRQQGAPTLSELRRSYDLLLLKLLSLLQDGDPPLAKDIDRSRAAIWEILADPKKFIESNLMAGA